MLTSHGSMLSDVILRTRCDLELFRPPLLGDDDTSGVVRNAILDFAEEVQEDDELLLYFSSHGQPMMIEAMNDTEVQSIHGTLGDMLQRP